MPTDGACLSFWHARSSFSPRADDIYDVPAGEDTYGLSDTSNTNDGYQRPHPHHNTNAAYDTAGQPARAPSYRNLAVDPRAPPLPPRGRVQVYEVSSVLQTCTHAAHAHAHAQHSHGTDHLHIGGEAITFVKKFSLPETGLFVRQLRHLLAIPRAVRSRSHRHRPPPHR